MENYALGERFQPYFPNGFREEEFGKGRRISTLTGCDLYVYKHELETRAAILFGVLFPGDCSDITRGINIIRAAERVENVVGEQKEKGEIKAITVETLLEQAWSDGGNCFRRLYEKLGNPVAVREYEGIITGYEMNKVSAAFMIEQGKRPLNTFIDKYLSLLIRATTKSRYCEDGVGVQNYRLNIAEIIDMIEEKTAVSIQKQKYLKEINGYNEQLHLAGLSKIEDFNAMSKELATASSDKRRVS